MNVRFLTCPYCFSSVPGGSCCWGSVGSFQAVTVTSTCQETGSHRHGLRMEFFTRGRGSRREAASDWNGRGRLVFCRVAMDSGHRQDVLLHCASPNWKFPEKFPSELRAARRKRQPMPGSRKGEEKQPSGMVPFSKASHEGQVQQCELWASDSCCLASGCFSFCHQGASSLNSQTCLCC